jgi:hypothetical protein
VLRLGAVVGVNADAIDQRGALGWVIPVHLCDLVLSFAVAVRADKGLDLGLVGPGGRRRNAAMS